MAKYASKYNRHAEITEQMHDLYSRKNEDYNDSFGRMFQELGPITALTRIGDKFERIKSLVTRGRQLVDDESVKDTLLDMANYCIMTIIELEEIEAKAKPQPITPVRHATDRPFKDALED